MEGTSGEEWRKKWGGGEMKDGIGTMGGTIGKLARNCEEKKRERSHAIDGSL